MRYDDWGVRSPRWAGLCSETAHVCGVPVHYVRAGSHPDAAPDAPVHLLVPPMTGSASMWIDLVPHLRRLGPVLSIDLPGTIAGDTGDPYRRGPSADLDARFVSAFVRQLPLERGVVLHGWSTGGLVAALAATRLPDQMVGVALIAPALPWRRTSRAEPLFWQTVGRLVVTAGPPVTRVLLRLAGRRLPAAKRTVTTRVVGGDLSRVDDEQVELWLDGLDAAREHPERLAGTASAYASAVKAMFITQRPTREALDALRVPALVVWGADDPLVDAPSLLQHARRPGWTAQTLDGVGHLLPVEAPEDYTRAVSRWLADLPQTREPR